MERLAPTAHMKQLTRDVMKQFEAVLGPSTIGDRLFGLAASPIVLAERLKVAAGRATHQPRTHETRYRLPKRFPGLAVDGAMAAATRRAAIASTLVP